MFSGPLPIMANDFLAGRREELIERRTPDFSRPSPWRGPDICFGPWFVLAVTPSPGSRNQDRTKRTGRPFTVLFAGSPE